MSSYLACVSAVGIRTATELCADNGFQIYCQTILQQACRRVLFIAHMGKIASVLRSQQAGCIADVPLCSCFALEDVLIGAAQITVCSAYCRESQFTLHYTQIACSPLQISTTIERMHDFGVKNLCFEFCWRAQYAKSAGCPEEGGWS